MKWTHVTRETGEGRPHSVWFHVSEMPGTGRSLWEAVCEWLTAGGGGAGGTGSDHRWAGGSQRVGKGLKLDGGDGCTTANLLKHIELHAQNRCVL